MSTLSFIANFLYVQLFVTPPYPNKNFAHQTIIVTGSNTGLGFEAAQHLVRLGAEKVILAVRTVEKGEAARKRIEECTGRTGVLEVWQLELERYESVIAFAKKAEGLRRLDAVLENAGIMLEKFRIAEEDEATVTVNVTSTFLLALLLLPKMHETSRKFNVLPRLTIVTSDMHFLATLPERNSGGIFEELGQKERADISQRYAVTKLLQVLIVRELADLVTASSKPMVVINSLTPGLCYSDFSRESSWINSVFLGVMRWLLGRTTEVGSRTLVTAIEAGKETHGEYMADSKIARVSPFVLSAEGEQSQKRVWAELSQKLQNIVPGILENI